MRKIVSVLTVLSICLVCTIHVFHPGQVPPRNGVERSRLPEGDLLSPDLNASRPSASPVFHVDYPRPDRPFPEPPASTPYTEGPEPAGGPEAMIWYLSSLHWPYGPTLPPEVIQAIQADQLIRPDELLWNQNKALEPWQYVGDTGMDVVGRSDRYSGRITDIRTFPGGGVRVSTPEGGLWQKSGTGWAHLTNQLPKLGIGSFDIHPTNPDTIIVGTGDHVTGGGVGFFRTFDAGSNWQNLGSPMGGQVFAIRYEPPEWGTNRVHAATRWGHGLSASAGDSNTWDIKKNGWCTSVAFDPSTPGLMYAGFSSVADIPDSGPPMGAVRGGLYRSVDSGESWERIEDPDLPDSTNFSVVTLDVCRQFPANVWALVSRLTVTEVLDDEGDPVNETHEEVKHLFRSSDSGVNWTEVSIPEDIDDRGGWYTSMLAVAQDDPDLVIIGGLKAYRTTNGGGDWNNLDIHADQHVAIWPGPGPDVWIGNDGGLYNSSDDGSNFYTDYNSLPITQYKEITVCYDDPNFVAGGSQDNGLSKTHDLLNWTVFEKGDGGGLVLRKGDCNFGIAVDGYYSSGSAFKRILTWNGFASYVGAEGGIPENPRWYPPVRWPGWLDVPYTATDYDVFRFDMGSLLILPRWNKITPTPFANYIEDMEVDEIGEAVYVNFKVPDAGDRIKAFQDGVWENRDLSGIPDGSIVAKVHPHPTTGVSGDVYALVRNAGSDTTGGRVFKSTDFGQSWTDISLSLGKVIPTDVMAHPTDPNQVYVATETGMVWTPNGGTDWFNANTGASPATFFADLYVAPDPFGAPGDYWLYAGTYGSGVFRRRITAGVAGPPDASTSVIVGAGEAHDDSVKMYMVVHPDGSGETLADRDASILVQILDANSVPVPGVAPERIKLHPTAFAASECGHILTDPTYADYPTDAGGWTRISTRGLPWGGYTGKVHVTLDGNSVRDTLELQVASTDISNDLRVDILDLQRMADATKEGFPYDWLDFVNDNSLDELDFAVLLEALQVPRNCPFTAPAVEAPEGQLGLYFDPAATQTGRIVFGGGEFDLYVIAEGTVGKMRGVEFKIPGLAHAAVEVDSIFWGNAVLEPTLITDDEFMVIFDDPYDGPGVVEVARFHCRLRSTSHVPFRLEPLDAPSFGTPTIPGNPGYIDDIFPPKRRPFAELSFAAVNPFPMAVYLGLQYQALGSAYLLTQANTFLLQGLDSVTGGGIHLQFANARNPGTKAGDKATDKGAPAGVDGAAIVFGTTLTDQNTQPGSTIRLAMVDDANNPVVDLQTERVGGLWSNTVSMPGIGAQSYHLMVFHQGQVVLDEPNFGGTFDSEIFLPSVYAVLLQNGEFKIDQEFGQSFLVVVDGNQFLADNLQITSQTQGSAGTGMLDSGLVEGTLLPDISILDVGVQRFDHVFHLAENVVLANETDAFRSQLIDPSDPGVFVINALEGASVELNLVRPRDYEPDAALDLTFSDGDDPTVKVGLVNGPTVHLTADLAATGSAGWVARGYLDGILQWEVAGGGNDVADVDLWPGKVAMGPEGPRLQWPVPVQVSALSGAGGPVNLLEIGQDGQAQGMPVGYQAEISYTSMAEAAFTDNEALSPVPHPVTAVTALLPNVPNPFNPSTEVRFSLEHPGHVKLAVYDMRGRKVRSLLDDRQPAGPGSVRWDGRDDHGATVAAGVYLALLKTPEGDFSRKLVLIK